MIRSSWVKYRDMGGPRYLGKREGGEYVNVYDPPAPWNDWTKIAGVVARSEGRFDTVVMYDRTAVTFGALQWTFKSGRLQRLLESFKSIPWLDFEKGTEEILFDVVCRLPDGRQVFEPYGFKIRGGKFVPITCGAEGDPLDPRKKLDQKLMDDICMGRRALVSEKEERQLALGLCNVFAGIAQESMVHYAQIEFGKSEMKRSLDYVRPPLKDVGGTIRGMLPDEVWGSPVPAIFFNLFQNSPGGAFKLYKDAWKELVKKKCAVLSEDGFTTDVVDDLLDIVWRRLCRSKYADWGFLSRQYLESGGKNPPRIKRIRPAIMEFYGLDLPYCK